jgi:hypothetical protein
MNAKLRTVLNGGNLTLRLLTFVHCKLILNEGKLNLRNIKWGLHCIEGNHVLCFKVLYFNPLDHQETVLSFYQFILRWILLLVGKEQLENLFKPFNTNLIGHCRLFRIEKKHFWK